MQEALKRLEKLTQDPKCTSSVKHLVLEISAAAGERIQLQEQIVSQQKLSEAGLGNVIDQVFHSTQPSVLHFVTWFILSCTSSCKA